MPSGLGFLEVVWLGQAGFPAPRSDAPRGPRIFTGASAIGFRSGVWGPNSHEDDLLLRGLLLGEGISQVLEGPCTGWRGRAQCIEVSG